MTARDTFGRHGSQAVEQAGGRVERRAVVLRLGDTIGIEQHDRAARQPIAAERIGKIVDRAKRRAALGRQFARLAARHEHQRRIMPGVAINKLAGSQVEKTGERGHDHHIGAVFRHVVAGGADLRARLDKHAVGGRGVPGRGVAYHFLGHGHEEGGRNALAGDIPDHEKEVVSVDQLEIEQIAADIARRLDARIEVDLGAVGEGREMKRQEPHLDRPSRREFALQTGARYALALQFGRDAPPSPCSATKLPPSIAPNSTSVTPLA